MRIPDLTYIVLSVYLLTGIHTQLINWKQHKYPIELELTWHNIGLYSTMLCGLQIFAGPPIYYLPVNVISATVGLVYINMHPENELPSSTHFGQFQKFGNVWVVGTVLPNNLLRKNFCTGSEFLFIATCALALTFFVSLTSDIYKRFPKNEDPEPLLAVALEGPKWHRWNLRIWFPCY